MVVLEAVKDGEAASRGGRWRAGGGRASAAAAAKERNPERSGLGWSGSPSKSTSFVKAKKPEKSRGAGLSEYPLNQYENQLQIITPGIAITNRSTDIILNSQSVAIIPIRKSSA